RRVYLPAMFRQRQRTRAGREVGTHRDQAPDPCLDGFGHGRARMLELLQVEVRVYEGQPATTRVNSPRAAPSAAEISAAVPRKTSSCSFVSSRATTSGRSGSTSSSAASDLRIRCGDSK